MQAGLSTGVCIGPIRLCRFGGVTVHAFRLENLRRHIAKAGGPAEFARKVGKSDSQITQIAGRNPSRPIGNKQAREYEKKLGLEVGALDLPPRRSEILAELANELEHRDPETQRQILDLIKRIPRPSQSAPIELPLAASVLPPEKKGRKKRKGR